MVGVLKSNSFYNHSIINSPQLNYSFTSKKHQSLKAVLAKYYDANFFQCFLNVEKQENSCSVTAVL